MYRLLWKVTALQKQIETWFSAVLGFRPTYVRPPFGDCDRVCEKTLRKLGYHVVNWNLDLQDWLEPNASTALKAMDRVREYEPKLRDLTEGVIVLIHDSISSTIDVLLPVLLQYFQSRSYEFVSAAECVGGSREHWYETI